MPPMTMKHTNDPKQELMNKLGDLSGIEVFNNAVLVATYMRPEDRKSTRLNSSH